MKILYVGLARSVWLFDLNRMNPNGLSLQNTIERLAERYKFAKAPKHPLDLNEQKALAFEHGTFVNSSKLQVDVSFSVYNDGVVGETRSSTDDATEFLLEVAGWAGEYGLHIPSEVKRGYVSQIDVELEIPLTTISPKLKTFIGMIEAKMQFVDGKARTFDVGAINFWTEDINKPLTPAPFLFERRLGTPFASNHYFSQAPLQTQDHIDLISDLEKLVKS